MLTEQEIENRFAYHLPSDVGTTTHLTISEILTATAKAINSICPDGREKAVVFTKLEEAQAWASAAVARNPETR